MTAKSDASRRQQKFHCYVSFSTVGDSNNMLLFQQNGDRLSEITWIFFV